MSYFTFEPKQERELIDLLEMGEGDYEVLSANERTSAQGNPMIELKLKVFDVNSQSKNISDYLVLNDKKMCLKKIRDFCYSSGLASVYESGKFSGSDCVGRSGKLMIGVEDSDPKYPPKNVVRSYLVNRQEQKKEEFIDDDITF